MTDALERTISVRELLQRRMKIDLVRTLPVFVTCVVATDAGIGFAAYGAPPRLIDVANAASYGLMLVALWMCCGQLIGLVESKVREGRGLGALTALFVGLTFAAGITPQSVQAQERAQLAEQGGNEDYCGRRLGQWFYCVRPAPPPPAEKKQDKSAASPQAAEIAELQAFQKELSEALQVATWKPTPENVEKYFLLQRVALNKGGEFADVWRRMIWSRPDLDYTLQRPVAELAKHNFTDERNYNRDLFLRSFSEEIGVFYVYRSTCGPCSVFNPIIRGFSDRYGLEVKAISTDGTPNPHFGTTLHDRGQLKAWGIDPRVTPALLLYQKSSLDPKTGRPRRMAIRGSSGAELTLRPCVKPKGCMTYVGAGVLTTDEIAERLFVSLSTEPGNDF